MKKEITMKDRVLKYMEDNGGITSWEAIQQLGCTRLSEYIRQLRAEDVNVDDKWITNKNRYGESIKYKKYFITRKPTQLSLF